MVEFENRREQRYIHRFTVFIEVLASSADRKDQGNVLISHTLDLSPSGLQTIVDISIPVDSILRICLDISDRDPIYVVGQVRWTREDTEQGGYRIGFSLFESAGSDLDSWNEALASLAERISL